MTTLPVDKTTVEHTSGRSPLVLNHTSFDTVTSEICRVNEAKKPPFAWYATMAISSCLALMLGLLIGYLIITGVGVWGNNNPVMWGFPIVNFVFWVGIGHAGTLISAILFLFRQKWRTSINRFAEAMTIFAVICAGTFPGIHIGRVWLAYWLFPIPNQMSMWPQFRSPLLWDVFAVGTYFTVSLVFWYIGMVPDLATLRDRATNKIKAVSYGIFALGWRGSMRHWHRYERAYLLLAALATPLVLSVHSVVSFDFAVAQLPGWHTTIFPPYFVAGAIFSPDSRWCVTLAVPAREMFGLEGPDHDPPPGQHEQDHPGDRHAWWATPIRWSSSSPGTPGPSMRSSPSSTEPSVSTAWAYLDDGQSCNVITPQLFWFKSMQDEHPDSCSLPQPPGQRGHVVRAIRDRS